MPEGPEVKVIQQGLHQILAGKYIHSLNFDMVGGRYQKKKPDNFQQLEFPMKVISVNCKGKFLYFQFQNDWYLYNTLGMSGGWYLKKNKHLQLELHYHQNKNIDSSDELKSLWFVDQRHFGTFKFVKGKSELTKKLATIGDDLLSDNIVLTNFITKYRKHNHKKIDVVLNDQKIFSGIGNYLKAEILYQAEISPHCLISDIPDAKMKDLLDAIKDRITASYKLGGASVEHYSDLYGKAGEFHYYFKVYKQKKDPLGNPVISERVSKPNDLKSQKTYWVPNVQKDKFEK